MSEGFLLGLGVALILRFIQWAMPAMPKPVAWAGIIAGGIVMLAEFLEPNLKPPLSAVACFLLSALCLGAGVHFYLERPSKTKSDRDYYYFAAQIPDPTNLTGQFKIRIINPSPGPFHDVNYWFCPWSSVGHDDAYWSIGGALKIPTFTLQNSDTLILKTIPANDYRIEYDATRNGLSYHFVQRLNIHERSGALVQEIEVRRWISGKDEKLVLSTTL